MLATRLPSGRAAPFETSSRRSVAAQPRALAGHSRQSSRLRARGALSPPKSYRGDASFGPATDVAQSVELPAVSAAPTSPPPRVTVAVLEELLAFYRSQHEEYDYWLSSDLIEGQIPTQLRGTLFRNGPGQLEVFGTRLNQPFDGDGMVCRFTFVDGKAHFSNRYVRTKGFLEEQAAGRILHPGAFAHSNSSGIMFNNPFTISVKNVANTGVLQWGGRLFALHESGLPHEMNPEDLSTLGETDLDGSIEGKGPFAAHYRIMYEADGSKRWVTFGATAAGLDACIVFYEYDEDCRLLHKTTTQPMKGGAFGFLHDLAVTHDYYILLQNPTRLNFRKLLFEYIPGNCGIAACITYDEQLPTKVHLVPRPGSAAPAQVIDTDPFFTFHHVNAFQDGEKVVLDTIGWKNIRFETIQFDTADPDYYTGDQRCELTRMVIDTASSTTTRMPLSRRCCEFSTLNPAVNGRPYRYTYLPASAVDDPVYWGPNQVLMKATLPGAEAPLGSPPPVAATEIWDPGPHFFMQEPVFTPRPGGTAEDDGWLLVLVNNAESWGTDLCIVDAQHISDGPVCTLHLPHHIPPGLHGSFSDRTDSVHMTPPPAATPEDWQPSFNTIPH